MPSFDRLAEKDRQPPEDTDLRELGQRLYAQKVAMETRVSKTSELVAKIIKNSEEKYGPPSNVRNPIVISYPMEVEDGAGNRYIVTPDKIVNARTGEVISSEEFIKGSDGVGGFIARNTWNAGKGNFVFPPDIKPLQALDAPKLNAEYAEWYDKINRVGEKERAMNKPVAPIGTPLTPLPKPVQLYAPQEVEKVTGRKNPDGSTKMVLQSRVMREWQTKVLSYSAETAFMLQIIDEVGSRIVGKPIEVVFVANFGSPIRDNTQRVSIIASEPVSFRAMLVRSLKEGILTWSVEYVTADATTNLTYEGRKLDFSNLTGFVRTVAFTKGLPSAEPTNKPDRVASGTPGKRKVVI